MLFTPVGRSDARRGCFHGQAFGVPHNSRWKNGWAVVSVPAFHVWCPFGRRRFDEYQRVCKEGPVFSAEEVYFG